MRRRNEVDVVCTFVLEAQHLKGKLICGQDSGVALLPLLADLEVLAEYAAEIAPGKEDGA
jgi:hypothetical protein